MNDILCVRLRYMVVQNPGLFIKYYHVTAA